MLLSILAVAILILIGLSYLFFRRFTVLRINGASMFPTLKDGQIRVLDRKIDLTEIYEHNINQYTNRIYVYESPSGLPVIKRLIYISYTAFGKYFWFEGDNPEHSEDSRHYGFVQQEHIYGELVTDFNTFIKRLFS
jgi:signal peptidase I